MNIFRKSVKTTRLISGLVATVGLLQIFARSSAPDGAQSEGNSKKGKEGEIKENRSLLSWAFAPHVAKADAPSASGGGGAGGGCAGGGSCGAAGGGAGAGAGAGAPCCFDESVRIAVELDVEKRICWKRITEIKIGDTVLDVDVRKIGENGNNLSCFVTTRVEDIIEMPRAEYRFLSFMFDNLAEVHSTEWHPFIVEEGHPVMARDLTSSHKVFITGPSGKRWASYRSKNEQMTFSRVINLKTATGNFLASKDGVNFFLVEGITRPQIIFSLPRKEERVPAMS